MRAATSGDFTHAKERHTSRVSFMHPKRRFWKAEPAFGSVDVLFKGVGSKGRNIVTKKASDNHLTGTSECVLEALLKGVSTGFERRNVEKVLRKCTLKYLKSILKHWFGVTKSSFGRHEAYGPQTTILER